MTRHHEKRGCFQRFEKEQDSITTVFVDKRLWKTKHSRKRFQNFLQSCALLTDRIEIHQSQPTSVTFRPSLRHASGL